MLYIIEGLDCSGKDTFIKRLTKFIDVPVFNGINVYDTKEYQPLHKYIKDKKEWQKAVDFEIINFEEQTHCDAILNRFIWSEIVYSDVLRGGSDPFFSNVLLPKLKNISKTIYLGCPVNELRKRIQKSDKKKPNEILHNLQKLDARFHRLFKETEIGKMIAVDSSEKAATDFRTDDTFMESIINFLKE